MGSRCLDLDLVAVDVSFAKASDSQEFREDS
jgi:hypothetical protein